MEQVDTFCKSMQPRRFLFVSRECRFCFVLHPVVFLVFMLLTVFTVFMVRQRMDEKEETKGKKRNKKKRNKVLRGSHTIPFEKKEHLTISLLVCNSFFFLWRAAKEERERDTTETSQVDQLTRLCLSCLEQTTCTCDYIGVRIRIQVGSMYHGYVVGGCPQQTGLTTVSVW